MVSDLPFLKMNKKNQLYFLTSNIFGAKYLSTAIPMEHMCALLVSKNIYKCYDAHLDDVLDIVESSNTIKSV